MMIRRANSSESGDAAPPHQQMLVRESSTTKRYLDHMPPLNPSRKSSLEDDSENGSSMLISPLWGEPGRRLPSVSSMLLLPPQISPRTSGFPEDIEDLAKEDKEREGMLIEEIVHATPKVAVEFTQGDTLCPNCHRPTCPVSNPPPGYYSERDVSKHSYPGDCWIIANGNVYDCSRYLTKHPGGSRAILGRAGKDASQDFEFHTKRAKNIWQRMQVGRVAQCNARASQDGDCCIS